MGGPQSQSGCGCKAKNPAPAGNQTLAIQPAAKSLLEVTGLNSDQD